jgi:hypothetical protein
VIAAVATTRTHKQIGESTMNAATASEIARLKTLTITQVVRQFESLFGEKCRSRNKRYLIRRIAWRLQANAEGDLSERAKSQAAELALDSEERVTSIKAAQQQTARTTDRGRTDRQDNGQRAGTGTSICDAPNIAPMTQQATSSTASTSSDPWTPATTICRAVFDTAGW